MRVLVAVVLVAALLPACWADASAGRRLLAKPTGKQPWKNAPPSNLTVVIHFNQLGQLAIRQTSAGLQLGSKYLALVALAQRTAIQRFTRPNVQVAAAAYAGHGVLTRLFPLLSANFDAVMRTYTSGLTPDERASVAARAQAIAQRIVAPSLADGIASWADWYFPPNGTEPPGVYQFTPGMTFALLPQLARTQPLFEQGGYNPLGSGPYLTDLAEVKHVGSATTTAAFKETAWFWFNGPGKRTASSAGQWSDVAASLLPLNTPAYAAADLLWRLNAAMFDASVVCWFSKYKFNFWRPITAIRHARMPRGWAGGGADLTWAPVMNTPAHPEHPSGHSCAGGAAGRILASFFGTDNMAITVGSEWPNWQNPTLAPRNYPSFSAAVQEGMDSRVFAGVHFRRAVNVGRAIGDAVAAYVWSAGPPASTAAAPATPLPTATVPDDTPDVLAPPTTLDTNFDGM